MLLNSFSALPFLSMPGGGEWIIILIAIIVLFGGRKIPELARGLGKGIRDFNDAKQGVKDDIEAGMKNPQTPPAPSATVPNQTTAPASNTTIVKES